MKTFVEQTDEWLRRRIRQIYWEQWKKTKTKYGALLRLGISHERAYQWVNTRQSYWRTANSWILATTLTNARLQNFGWVGLGDVYKPTP